MRRFLPQFVNKNPRNLEVTRVQRRPTGWQFEANSERRNFFYKVVLINSKHHMDAHLIHHENGRVLTASTREPEIAQQLYSTVDRSAAHNLGRILADRCRKSGIQWCIPGTDSVEVERSARKKAFYDALTAGGIVLEEPTSIEHNHTNDPSFTWSRFPIKHTREDKLNENPVIRK